MFRRNLWTGELEEVAVETTNGRAIIYSEQPGRPAIEDERFRHTQTYADHKPLISQALGCHTNQIEEFNRRAHEAGRTDVEYVPDPRGSQYGGVARFTAKGETGRNGEMKARGVFDGDASYGDYAGR